VGVVKGGEEVKKEKGYKIAEPPRKPKHFKMASKYQRKISASEQKTQSTRVLFSSHHRATRDRFAGFAGFGGSGLFLHFVPILLGDLVPLLRVLALRRLVDLRIPDVNNHRRKK
jgi:hypothetical protein